MKTETSSRRQIRKALSWPAPVLFTLSAIGQTSRLINGLAMSRAERGIARGAVSRACE